MAYKVSIVGEQHYRQAVAELVRGQQVWLEHESGNAHDPRAVRAVDAHDRTLGYVPRDSWVHRVLLDEGKSLRAFVTALEREGADNRLGVLLEVEVVGAPVGADGPPASEPDAPAAAAAAKKNKTAQGCGCLLLILVGLAALGQCMGSPDADPVPGASGSSAAVGTAEAVAAAEEPYVLPEISDADARADTLAHCTEAWPDDLALRGGCKRNGEDGLASFREIAARYKDVPDMQAALGTCLGRHANSGVVDWALVGGCARNNEDGLKSMAE